MTLRQSLQDAIHPSLLEAVEVGIEMAVRPRSRSALRSRGSSPYFRTKRVRAPLPQLRTAGAGVPAASERQCQTRGVGNKRSGGSTNVER
jgi:hypothetical protein